MNEDSEDLFWRIAFSIGIALGAVAENALGLGPTLALAAVLLVGAHVLFFAHR
jgi:hypothetical protein